jgi:predicted permease
MLALLLAILLRDVPVPQSSSEVVSRLADMLSPPALASIGWQLDLRSLAGNGRRLAVGLTWKLLLAPAMVLGLMLLFRGHLGLTEKVVVAQAAMAPMVTAGVVAADHDLSPGLASAMIAVGVPLSLVTVPVWWHVMGLL